MTQSYHIFISYSQEDGNIAASLASQLYAAGLRCFMADRSILATAEWEPELRKAMVASDSVLLIMTPRSKNSLWVAAEVGAAWVLEKKLIPVTMFVKPRDLLEPLRKFQARQIETPEQREILVRELRGILLPAAREVALFADKTRKAENFTDVRDWEGLLKVGEWARNSATGAITGEGMYRYLLSHQTYGSTSFNVHCRLAFTAIRPTATLGANAGIVLGWSIPHQARQYYNLMLTGDDMLLEKIGFRGGGEFEDYQHVDKGCRFPIKLNEVYDLNIDVYGSTVDVHCNGEQLYTVKTEEPIPVGRIGLRPWRSILRCEQFDVSTDTWAPSASDLV
jgi:hypothetical protein